MSGCHPTYIGQLERGEKNATLESIEKIAAALNVSLSKLFEKLGGQETETRDIPLECYEFLSAKTKEEQEHLYRILLEMDKYKRNWKLKGYRQERRYPFLLPDITAFFNT